MSAALIVRRAGPGVTVQDGGRHGLLRWGVTVAGPMDAEAFARAHVALGNPPETAAIEISVSGLEVEAQGAAIDVAVVGLGFELRLDDRTLPAAAVLRLEPGVRLAVKPGATGAWGYLAVAGRIDLPPVLGSLATHTRSGLGGLAGRGLEAGDVIPLADLRPPLPGLADAPMHIAVDDLERDGGPFRVVLGPQDDHFAPDQIAAFLARDWLMSPRSDRMAYALDGPPLAHAKGHDIVSDAVALGAVQVPGSGFPYVLMADRQPTGGYPKIATVISADVSRLARLRPGASVRFAAVSIDEAVAARRRLIARRLVPPILTPMAGDLSSEALLSVNLISGFVG